MDPKLIEQVLNAIAAAADPDYSAAIQAVREHENRLKAKAIWRNQTASLPKDQLEDF